jgi:FkbM family methyltransferase
MLKAFARKILPIAVQRNLRSAMSRIAKEDIDTTLARLREEFWAKSPRDVIRFLNYTVRITDGPNFYMQYKDEFIRRIYHFETQRPDPLIIDGGGNIGMSILYFKHIYPNSRLIAFEPDLAIFRLLEENMTRNGLTNVTLVNAGLGAESGTATFFPDGSAGGRLENRDGGVTVEVRRLSDYLAEPVDFLKLNIEGEELPVLREAEASGTLRNVRELVLEYHGWPNGEQRLGPILDLLDRQGFRYLIHDFDAETCFATKPPFHVTPQTTWFCLVYARQL